MAALELVCGFLTVAPLMILPAWLLMRPIPAGRTRATFKLAARHLSLDAVTAVAWILVGLALLSPYTLVGDLCFLAGLPAAPVAVVGTLLMLLRRLSRPDKRSVADYDDAPPSG